MMKPNFMEKLLKGSKVEWKRLEEVAELYGGLSGKNKEDFVKGNALYISYKNIFDNIEINFNKLESVKVSDSENQHVVKYGDILFTGSSETAAEAGMSSAVTTKFEDKVYLNSFSFGVRFNDDTHIIPQFSKYLFRSHFMRTEIAKTASGVTRFNISKARLKKLLIPIPPIKVQEEIVRILDVFKELTAEITAELTAEITARKKQYEYYRDKLLTFEEGEVKWKTLGEVAKIQRGASPRPIAKFITDEENGVPWIKIGDTLRNSKYVSQTEQRITPEGAMKSRILKKGDFIMSNSMSFGRPYILNIDGAIHDGWASISDFGDKLNSDFLYHFLSSNLVQNYWASKINSGSVSNLNSDIIKSLVIPLPPLTKQERIASILDKFDALTSSITEDLPREIELRQKQYEYYRNMLLSFPKGEV